MACTVSIFRLDGQYSSIVGHEKNYLEKFRAYFLTVKVLWGFASETHINE